jgi:hypothetical protein
VYVIPHDRTGMHGYGRGGNDFGKRFARYHNLRIVQVHWFPFSGAPGRIQERLQRRLRYWY